MRVYTYHDEGYEDLRDRFVNITKKVFSEVSLIEFIDMAMYSDKFDVIVDPDGESYIINRESGEYINWYKFSHLGRDIHMNFDPDNLEKFLMDFKGE